MKRFWERIRISLFKLKYKIIFTLNIKFKMTHIVSNNERTIGKSTLIYELARKYNLPVFTNWKELYRGCNVINPLAGTNRMTAFNNTIILVDFLEMQTELTMLYVLQQRGNILIGFGCEPEV